MRYCPNMPLKIGSPLFSSSASGSIRGVGSFRATAGGVFLCTGLRGNTLPVPALAAWRAAFAEAKAAHTALAPQWVIAGGRHRWVRVPSWPAFWAQWLIDHPLLYTRHVQAALQLSGFVFAARLSSPRHLALSSVLLDDFVLGAYLISHHEMEVGAGQIAAFGFTCTLTRV